MKISIALTFFFICRKIAGNLLAMSSSCILYGPVEQSKKMFHSTRLQTILLFFVLMFTTICIAFISSHPNPLLILALIFAQYIALVWYSLSFIPWGREMVKDCILPIFCNCITPEDWKECMAEDVEQQPIAEAVQPPWYQVCCALEYFFRRSTVDIHAECSISAFILQCIFLISSDFLKDT